ncbi:MAG TPA: sigma-54 dependent transcriptional regulator [Flavobacteriales bacterium]|nr:sigma-54 dependent transcriptional regulator [Flavobacteriales bacterium]HRO38875.1 sigma-54 dependent transcriptional regulator [Flavobacteriales bacterium]HRP81437.1 sigma-54 dependent transcriptional regulator [Flavobacteriales bacterium]HRQ83720.1 sigma-54 dependent transcriptional regulator [Flavobacteriales bacterium]
MPAPHLLVIDDDADICTLLSRFLEKQGYQVDTALRGSTAKDLLKRNHYELVLCDHRLPDTDSEEMLLHIKSVSRDTAVIIITGYSDVRTAVNLMRKGAYDYVGKPLYPDEILMRIKEALNKAVPAAPAAAGRKQPAEGVPTAEYVQGTGPQAELLAGHIALVAPTDMTVLITGETGTGKEYVARELHRQSGRAGKVFIAVDCGALPKELAGSELFGHVKGAFTGALGDKRGSFEQANGGTLFLDEIGNLTYENQVKLLRVLQERRIKRVGDEKDIEVDVRVLAATNENLHVAVSEGRFREDLLHRINEFTLDLLPLRERPKDIMVFAHHFLKKANQQLSRHVEGFDAAVEARLMVHAWPGNLRELGNVVKRAVLLTPGGTVQLNALPAEVIAGAPAPSGIQQGMLAEIQTEEGLRGVSHTAEKQAILKALERNGFNKSRTAEMLNIDRKTLYNKLKSFGIEI